MTWPVIQNASRTGPPGKCVVSGDIEGPFLDLGIRVPYVDPHLIFHVPVVEEMGRSVGMVPRAEHEALKTKVAELDSKYAALARYAEAVDALETAEKELA